MSQPFDGTIDWEEYWTSAEDVSTDEANASAEFLVEPFLAFLEWAGEPMSYADVGCGGGTLVTAVADRYPQTSIIGYDAAESVIEQNRADHRGTYGTRVAFERARLPEFDPDRTFDIVSSVFTLCYVRDIRAALEALYEAVAPGGYLVCTYHNRYAAALFRKFAAAPHEHIPPSSGWDPDRFADRFSLVLEEESVLSHRRIHDILGRWPQSLWSVDEDVDPYGAWRQNPFVYIPK